MELLDRWKFDLIRDHVIEECQERGFKGIFAMVDLRVPGTIYWDYILRASVLRIGEDRPDANVLAIALSKLAYVYGHRKNTGDETGLIGELSYKGGRLSEDGNFIYVFSGAPPEVDDERMQSAEQFHKTLK